MDICIIIFSSVQFCRSVVSDSLWPHELQHVRLPCPLLSPWICSDSYPFSQWCHPAISSAVAPFFSCRHSFPASGSFSVSWLFVSGGQRIGVSTSASVLPMNIQVWFPLGLTGWISLQSKWLWRVFSSTTVSLVLRFLYGPPLTSKHDYWKNHSFDYTDLCWPRDVSAF